MATSDGAMAAGPTKVVFPAYSAEELEAIAVERVGSEGVFDKGALLSGRYYDRGRDPVWGALLIWHRILGREQ